MTIFEDNDEQPTRSLTNLSAEKYTDSQLSDVFAESYMAKARYCHEANCWFIWNGKQWVPDTCEQIITLSEDCVKGLIARNAKKAGKEELHKAIGCLSAGRLRSIADLAKTKMPIKKAQLNAEPWYFNCGNGVLDLKTGELMPHSPEFYQSFIANVEFDKDADCPKFKAFIKQIMLEKTELIDYLHRAAGYTLSGITSEQCFFLLMGDGRNGKSTLLELMRHIMGDYARTVGAKTLMMCHNDQIPSDIALLEGKRYAPCSETSSIQKLNEARIKTLTGGDQVEARKRYADEYNYTPQFKLWVATNSVPKISGTDEGIWRRVHRIPFELRLAPEQVDKSLLDILKKESPGILNWLLAGCLQWQDLGGLNAPDEVKNATDAYRAEMDTVRDFARDCLTKKQGGTITNQQMKSNFSEWYYNNVGDHDMPLQKELTQRLRQLGYQSKGGKARKWVNVQFIVETDISDEELLEHIGRAEPSTGRPTMKPGQCWVTPAKDSMPSTPAPSLDDDGLNDNLPYN